MELRFSSRTLRTAAYSPWDRGELFKPMDGDCMRFPLSSVRLAGTLWGMH